MWTRRRHFLGGHERLAELGECFAAEFAAHRREELAFFLLDVVANVLDEHRGLGVEALVGGVHVGELGKHPLDHVVLLKTLERHLLGAGNRRSRNRVEHLLLDGCVNRELFDDPIDDLALLDVRPISCLLEAFEESLDDLVVITQHCDGVHRQYVPRGRPGSAMNAIDTRADGHGQVADVQRGDRPWSLSGATRHRR